MSTMPSRHGRRALVTRPRGESMALAAALDRRGIEAIIEPLLNIYYRDAPPPDLAGVQAVLCTSAKHAIDCIQKRDDCCTLRAAMSRAISQACCVARASRPSASCSMRRGPSPR
jgi:uroporphyrinogen-III synthase